MFYVQKKERKTSYAQNAGLAKIITIPDKNLSSQKQTKLQAGKIKRL